MSGIPAAIEADFAHGKRLEWWTLAWMSSIIVVMYLTMGASQAMQSALIEDLLSLVPAITFLVASRFEPRQPTAKFPFGFARVNSLAFLVAAVALTLVGLFVAWEAASALLHERGHRWTFSRISGFNAASLAAHRRLGATDLGRAPGATEVDLREDARVRRARQAAPGEGGHPHRLRTAGVGGHACGARQREGGGVLRP